MEPVQPEASVVQTGLSLRYIGKPTNEFAHCYAYSGNILIGSGGTSADTLFLDFTSGSGYAIVDINWSFNERASDTYYKQVKINGVSVYMSQSDTLPDKHSGQSPITFLIPPQSRFQVLYGSDASGTVKATVVLTGRVYGAV